MDFSGLPSMEFSFTISVRGAETNELYEGNFVYTRLNYRAKSEAAKLTTQLNGDLENLEPSIKFLNSVLGVLRFGIIDSPKWWRDNGFGLELFDDNVIIEIYRKIDDFEQEWSKKVKKEPQKPKKKDE